LIGVRQQYPGVFPRQPQEAREVIGPPVADGQFIAVRRMLVGVRLYQHPKIQCVIFVACQKINRLQTALERGFQNFSLVVVAVEL
jgi:hypothetical protein